MKDPLPIRLAGLAADLRRVSSSARRATDITSVDEMLEESRYFIEWTAADTEIDVAAELVDIQLLLGMWRKAWPDAQQYPAQRLILSVQAKKWSDQVMAYSGLLD